MRGGYLAVSRHAHHLSLRMEPFFSPFKLGNPAGDFKTSDSSILMKLKILAAEIAALVR